MFHITVLIAVIIGAVLVTVTFIGMLAERGKNEAIAEETLTMANTALTEIDAASDAALREINETSRLVLDELAEKYQALLFLYNMLDEKEKALQAKPQASPRRTAAQPAAAATGKNASKHAKIAALRGSGMSVADIAKQLNMGQGEVQLILDLGGRG